MSTVKAGDVVSVHYKGTLDSGEVFDSSEGRDPLQFEVGSGQVIPGFDQAVTGLKVGEKRTVRIAPEDAYGPKREELVVALDRALFGDQDVEVGQHLDLQDDRGNVFHADVLEVADETVRVDLNHHLAGEALTFEITVVDVKGA